MRDPEISFITFTLPKGMAAPEALVALGAKLGVDGDREVAVFEVELATRSIGELRENVMSVLAPGDRHVSMRVYPTADRSKALHEQLDALRQDRRGPLSLGYYVVAAGWGLCVLATPDRAETVSCSYLEDALGDLVTLGCAVLESGKGRCSFAEEPGEYRWVFASGVLRVVWFGELYGHRPDEEGQLVFEVECSAIELARAVLRCAGDVEQRYGEENYASLWIEHEFPSARVEQLKARIREAKEGSLG